MNEFEYLNRLELLNKAYKKLCFYQDIEDLEDTDNERYGSIVKAENTFYSLKYEMTMILTTNICKADQDQEQIR